ncbi:hypothetical protein ACGFKZ_29385 [Micromonospora tulbaghiae]|uniref:hypothetical protein n=1 Tax=Micromonospora tulbaghiae TaxID=479978 RepID=UPI00371B1206
MSDVMLAAARKLGQVAARLGHPVTACPYNPGSGDAVQRAAARAYVDEWLRWRPDAAAAVDVDDVDDQADGEVARHLPGRHNQGTHGNRFKVPGDRASGLRIEGKARKAHSHGAGEHQHADAEGAAAEGKPAAAPKRKAAAGGKPAAATPPHPFDVDDDDREAKAAAMAAYTKRYRKVAEDRRAAAAAAAEPRPEFAAAAAAAKERAALARLNAAAAEAEGDDDFAAKWRADAATRDLAMLAAAEPDGMVVAADPARPGSWVTVDVNGNTGQHDTKRAAEKARQDRAEHRRRQADPAHRRAAVEAPAAAEPAEQVREAYRQLAKKPGDYVMLSDLRSALPDMPPADFDAAVVELNRRERGAHLVPESNQKVLRPEERAAAVNIGNQQKHLLAIMGDPSPSPAAAAAAAADPPLAKALANAARRRQESKAAAAELTLDGAETAFVPGARSTIGLADRPNVGRDTGPAAQQLGMFDVADQRQMQGQGALLDEFFGQAGDLGDLFDQAKGGKRR